MAGGLSRKANYVCARKYLARCTSFVWTVHVRGVCACGDQAHGDGNGGSNCCSHRRWDMGYDRSTSTHWTARHSDFEKGWDTLSSRFGQQFFSVFLSFLPSSSSRSSASYTRLLFHTEWHDAKGRSQKFRGTVLLQKEKSDLSSRATFFSRYARSRGVLYGKEFAFLSRDW